MEAKHIKTPPPPANVASIAPAKEVKGRGNIAEIVGQPPAKKKRSTCKVVRAESKSASK